MSVSVSTSGTPLRKISKVVAPRDTKLVFVRESVRVLEYCYGRVVETFSLSRWQNMFWGRRKPELQLARVVSRFKRIRRKRFKVLGVVALVVVGLFDYFAWRHLVYGELSFGLWVGFGLPAMLSIPVTFFGFIAALVLFLS